MSGMMHNLIEIMNDQAQRYEELLGLSLEKKEAIVKNEIEELQKITNLEQRIVSQNNKLEKKRMALTADIAEVLGKGSQEITLGELITLMDGQDEQASLKAVGNRIRDVMHKLGEANDLNNALIQNALDYVEYSLNVIRSSTDPVQPTISIKGGQITEDYSTLDVRN
jgi:flagellar biosynthesis/type III secretory pathway chaperone